MRGIALRIRAGGRLAALVVLLGCAASAGGQEKGKNYKDLDREALRLFQEGKYEAAYKNWSYIHNAYPRGEFRDLRNDDPKFLAWQAAFHASIVREGLAKKYALLKSPKQGDRDKAEQAHTRAVEVAREMMRRSGLQKAAQDKLIKAAEDPLLEALKKKDAPPAK